jgi:hypothetical protein
MNMNRLTLPMARPYIPFLGIWISLQVFPIGREVGRADVLMHVRPFLLYTPEVLNKA